jgi:hypothetical protein
MLTFVEHPTFSKQAKELFEDEEFRLFQLDLQPVRMPGM